MAPPFMEALAAGGGAFIGAAGGGVESCAEAFDAAKQTNSPASNDDETRRGFFI
ncbi:MAG TPA: hypothetical protein VGP64_01940 [Polyangia bacterium]|jgi:hypothetical protein